VDWSLIIMDPLSRWAGGGVESNNEAATRFVQVVETLTTVRGKPSALLAHHSSQVSARAGQSDARGVTGIRDGFRWQASLDLIADEEDDLEGILLRNPKSNYSLRFRPLLLVRNSEPGIEGTLRPAEPDEEEALKTLLPKERQSTKQRDEAKQSRDRAIFEERCELVAGLLPAAPEHMNRDQLGAALESHGHRWGYDTIRRVVAHLIDAGRVGDLSDGSKAKPRKWARTGE
jgi:hypothetical protein